MEKVFLSTVSAIKAVLLRIMEAICRIIATVRNDVKV
jgi:hypothetical protein